MVWRWKLVNVIVFIFFVLLVESNPIENNGNKEDNENISTASNFVIKGNANLNEKRMELVQDNVTSYEENITNSNININQQTNSENGKLKTFKKLRKLEEDFINVYSECGSNLSCAEKKLVRLVDFIDGQKSFSVVSDAITIENIPEQKDENDNEKHEKEDLIGRVCRYVRSHSVNVQLPNNDIFYAFGQIIEAETPDIKVKESYEGRTRVRRLIIPLVLLLKLKLAILLPIFISAIALISFKGLWAGLAAMMVAGALGLRQLFANNNDNGPNTKFTLGVIKPQIVPDVYHDYWNRAGGSFEHPYRGHYAWDRPQFT